MKTKITELFGIEYPIICGGMLWVTDAKLCAAISNAGGMGCITADQHTSGESLRAAIKEVKALTDKPFGVNITLMPSFRITEEVFDDFFRVCAEEKVTNIEVSGMFATKYIPMLHEAGVKITHKVGAVRHAMKIERLGYDAVIVAGVEEGGHPLSDNVATTVLLPKVCENVHIPVLCTGGMVDGKSMAAALCLGADGIMMATRFMASEECWIHDNIKNMILELNETDTKLFCSSILQARGIKNSVATTVDALEREMELAKVQYANDEEKLNEEVKRIRSEIVRATSGKKLLVALKEGNRDGAAFLLGQSIGRINEIKSCKAIIDDTMRECEETLRARCAML